MYQEIKQVYKSTQTGGQLVIALGESRFVVGQGLAQKVMVERSPDRHSLLVPGGVPGDSATIPPAVLTIPLSQMRQGQEGVVARVAGETRLRRRILEMGINRGATVYVEKYAPLKDPIELIVKGYHVSMRVEEAAHISVEGVKTVKNP